VRLGEEASMEHDEPTLDRRGFLAYASVALSGLVALAATIVGAVFAVAPAVGKRGASSLGAKWSPVPGAKPDRAAGPTAHRVRVVADAGWAMSSASYAVFVDVKGDGTPAAFSARCPHEGCTVTYRGDDGEYVCPCHASRWTRDGARVSGPTKRGLDPLDVRTNEQGGLDVRYTTFALDTPDRIELG
jgi:menaquinol-cytochrome c reductase iron-sulfur subunit